jgi:hypothetical protein
MKRAAAQWVVLSIAIAILGTAWMQVAVAHYKQKTGRGFYALAGYHYSQPEWGFEYYPGGDVIHRWTTTVPWVATVVGLGVALVVALISERRSGWKQVTAIVAAYAVTAIVFTLVAAWYDINVTGIFI